VDALDGTNSFALPLPIYGVCLTLCHDDDPVLAVLYDSHLRRKVLGGSRRRGVRGAAVRLQYSVPRLIDTDR
jgi:myo-inositol-1(or 4)-monophosphatase